MIEANKFTSIPYFVEAVRISAETEKELFILVESFSDEDGKVHRLPFEGPFEGIIIPTKPEGYREFDGRIRMYGRDLYDGWLVKFANGDLDHYTEESFRKNFISEIPVVSVKADGSETK